MYHFFIRPQQLSDGHAYIDGADYNHIVNVLRMKNGEKILISTGEDWDYMCTIESISEGRVNLQVISENEQARELSCDIILCQGLPKSDKMEYIIQKSVELGVKKVMPVASSRCVVKLDEKKAQNKTLRWQAIAQSAAEQSKRSIIPQVTGPVSFADMIRKTTMCDVKIIAYELSEDMDRTRKLISQIKPNSSIAVIIGPEGGLTEDEVNLAVSHGFEPVTLGRRILRTETAGLVILSWLMIMCEP